MIELGSKFNRSYTLNLMFNDEWCNLTIFFNKNNLYTAYQLDQKTYLKTKDSCSSFIFFDIRKSSFANTFLDISDLIKSSNLDIKNQFNSLYTQYKDIVRYELNETIKLSKVKTPHGWFDNTLSVYVFRLCLEESNFLYCLTERQFIDTIQQRKIVRTSSYQLQTSEAGEYLSSLIFKYSPQKRVIDTPESIIKSVVTDGLTPQQKRGGIL